MSPSPRGTLHYTRCPVPTATGIAADLGWLADAVRAQEWSLASLQEDATDLVDRHFDHRLVGLWREGGNVPALWARSLGPHTRLVGVTWVDEYQAILARPDDDIREPSGLRGRRVGLPREDVPWADFRRAMALRGFTSALSSVGLSLAEVQPVDVHSDQVHRPLGIPGLEPSALAGPEPFGQERDALISGAVDAIYVKGARGRAVADGFVEVLSLGDHPDRALRVNNGTPRTITVHAELLQRHPDLVEAVLVQLLRASDWAQTDPAALAAVLGRETGADPARVLDSYDPDGLRPRLDDERLTALASQSALLRAHGLIDVDVDVASWAAPEPLAAAERRLAVATTP